MYTYDRNRLWIGDHKYSKDISINRISRIYHFKVTIPVHIDNMYMCTA